MGQFRIRPFSVLIKTVKKLLYLLTAMEGNYKSVKIADGITADEAIKTVKEELPLRKFFMLPLDWKKAARSGKSYLQAITTN